MRESHEGDDDPGLEGYNVAISKLHQNSVQWTLSPTFWVQILALPLTWGAQKGGAENQEAERWRGVNPRDWERPGDSWPKRAAFWGEQENERTPKAEL